MARRMGEESNVHDRASVATQLMIDVPPYSILAGFAVTFTFGAGVTGEVAVGAIVLVATVVWAG